MTTFVPVPKEVVRALLDTKVELGPDIGDDALIRNDLVAALRRPDVPPWDLAVEALRQLRKLVDERGPKAVHELDQLRGTMRDDLDRLGITLHDEVAVYHGLAFVGMVVEIARNGLNNGAIPLETYRAIAEIGATIGSGLLDYVPREVFSR